MDRKICSICKKEKDIENFIKARKFGQYRGACKECTNNYRRISGEHIRYSATENGKRAKAKYRASEKGKRVIKNHSLKKNFGITIEDFEEIILLQGNKCKICQKNFNTVVIPQVDHCHSKGHVRGILCKKCNLGLGHFEDNVELMLNAINYLGVRN